jgi:regulator of sigma E protease
LSGILNPSWIWEYALPFVVVLGAVVLFHEFGHYLVAKWMGITVEVFSVGFGHRIAGFRRGGTDYRLSWIPLGGYVKLKGETPEEATGGDPGNLLSRPRWQRFLVFVMGAVFNLITAFVLTATIYMNGVREPAYLYEAPVVGEIDPDSPAREAGIRPGDLILSFGGRKVTTWKELQILMLLSPRQTKDVVLSRGGEIVTTRLAILSTPSDVGRPGIGPRTEVLVGDLQPGRPAEKAGLRRGDRIVAINGVEVTALSQVFETIRGSPEKPLRFTIARGAEKLETTIVPVREDGRGLIGFVPTTPTVVRSYLFLASLRESLRSNVEMTGLVFVTFKKLLTREISLRAFSGPIELYRFSGEAAQEGLIPFLQLIAFVSLQLGIINLFPIPPLDGGHIAFLLIEGGIRRDLPPVVKERLMQVGLILLLLFMGTIIFFDATKHALR